MYRNYKIVVNTAAGRRRYMQYLVPFIVSSGIVDRYDIWVNTHNGADIEFFKQLAAKFPVVNLVWQPDGVVGGIASINAFYRDCVEENTIYFKMDDDIVWMEQDAIQKMVDFRIDNPNYFLVSPLVINNSLSTYLLQVTGKIQLDQYYNSSANNPVLWKSGNFAAQLHTWFLDGYLKKNNTAALHVGKHEMGMTRFSINAILWFGEDMKALRGIVPGDDEEFLSCIHPTAIGKANCWNGDVLFSHFAFFTQREQLDKMSILEQYGEYLLAAWKKDENMSKISDAIQAMMKDIAGREQELLATPSPYKKNTPPVSVKSLKHRIFHASPMWMKDLYITWKTNRKDKLTKYIVTK